MYDRSIRATYPVLRAGIVAGSIVDSGLVVYSLIVTRAELDRTTLESALASCGILVLYGVVGWFATYFIERVGLRYGAIYGLAAGAVLVGYGALINLTNISAAAYQVASNSSMSLVFALCIGAGLLATRETGRLGTGIRAGALAGLIGILIGTISMSLIIYQFSDIVLQGTLLHQDFLKSGLRSSMDFAILDELDGRCVMLTICPVLGAVFGAFGGLISRGLWPFWRRGEIAKSQERS